AELAEFINKYRNSITIDEKTKTALCEGKDSEECLSNIKDTKHVLLWFKKTVAVKDDTTGKWHIYFEGKTNKLVEKGKLSTEQFQKAKEIADMEIDKEENMRKTVRLMEDLLAELESVKNTNIVAVVDTAIDETNHELGTILGKLGAAKRDVGYVFTFREWKRFHNELFKAFNNKSNSGKLLTCKEDYSVCYIKALIGNDKLEITTEFMRALYNNITFINALEYSENLSYENAIKAAKKAKTKVAEDEEFQKIFIEDILTKSYMIEDNFSNDFKNDFMNLATIGQIAANNFKEWKFLNNNEEKKLNAGEYTVWLNYNWQDNSVKVEFTNYKSLAKLDSENNTKYSRNPFFKLAFDGSLGIEDNTRVGYGTSFEMEETKNRGILIAGTEAEPIWQFTGSGGLRRVIAEKKTEFAATNSGTLLRIEADEFTYIPSTPVALQLELTPSASKKEGILYEITDSHGNIVSGGNSVFEWTNSETITDSLLTSLDAKEICGEIKGSHYGFKTDISNSEKFNTVAFVPAQEPHLLKVYCAQGRAILRSKSLYGTSKRTSIAAGAKEKPTTILLNKGRLTSLKEYIEQIDKGKLCVITGTNSMILAWNDAALQYNTIATEGAAKKEGQSSEEAQAAEEK
ncbi:MAG: hypothetical protein J7L14_02015, partial [Candidatus Diapherotrites archaeon]|nr:hypothetical protein [Candidatus Diapherotrites archaeon]